MQKRTLIRTALAGVFLAAAVPGSLAVAETKPVGNKTAEVNTNATLIYYDMAGNETLDPADAQNNSSYSHEALLAVYDTLIRLDDAGNPGPGLAESWTRNDDLTTMTMKLRHGVTFHDGTPFNAAAVKRNFERSASLGKRIVGTMAETVALIDAVEVQGDDVVTLKLKSPSGQIEYWLASTPGMMISPAALTEDVFGGKLSPIGAGPYRVKSFEANVSTITVRNDRVLGRDRSPACRLSAPLRTRRTGAPERTALRAGQCRADRRAADP